MTNFNRNLPRMSIPSNSIHPNSICEIMPLPPQRQPAAGRLRRTQVAVARARPHAGPARGSIRANPRIDVFAYQPSGRGTRAKPQIRISPNHPHEPRADHRTRAKPQIRNFANQPIGRGAGPSAHANPGPTGPGTTAQARPLPHPIARRWHRPQVAERPRRCWAAYHRDG